MSYAWYICPYKRRASERPERYCAMDDFTKEIFAEKGDWSESEIEGNCAIVKVRAGDELIKLLDETFQRIPGKTVEDVKAALGVTELWRYEPRYDVISDSIKLDGARHRATPLERIDAMVK